MTYNISGTINSEPTKLSTTNATSLLPADLAAKRVTILSIEATEISGNTPTLTLELNDGTTSYYGGLRNARAMVARATDIINEPKAKPAKWTLKATASAANQIDILVTYIAPDALGR